MMRIDLVGRRDTEEPKAICRPTSHSAQPVIQPFIVGRTQFLKNLAARQCAYVFL